MEHNSYSAVCNRATHTPCYTPLCLKPHRLWGNEVEEAPAPDVKDKIKSLPRERQMIYTRHFT